MDNYFSNVELFGTLRKVGIGAVGTGNIKDKLFPDELNVDKKKAMKLLPWNTLVGKVVKPQIPEIVGPFSNKSAPKKRGLAESTTSEDVNVLGWNDNGLVHMITTVHNANQNKNDPNSYIIRNLKKPAHSSSNYLLVAPLFKNGENTANLPIPVVIDDYNNSMSSVNIADQLRSYYCTQSEIYRNWIPIFFWLLDLSIINSYLLFTTQNPDKKRDKLHFDFRVRLSRYLLEDGKKDIDNQNLSSEVFPTSKKRSYVKKGSKRSEKRLIQGVDHSLKCTKTRANRLYCIECRYTKNESKNPNDVIVRKTMYTCSYCEVPLCTLCTGKYHSI
ncbi:uncharacterized protein SAPINGB_P005459 [Magnusiomyces paraingens]|uniref:PiggyBac transposable element-derived protein domain-containing protein n=1 Tax=Magnusiomyces paraingens TaxID=2606893 RepID=A0A5E8C0R2_9ASCO|nr:uncharacterized protein SAPINGB_P005459 [Saprochaete ingens]VVT56972.1 unnamed protein product [Saprochaete ingens]